MADTTEIFSRFNSLYEKLGNWEPLQAGPILLAHYTSVEVLESIVRDRELWFSNPLFMNDIEEMRFGLNEGKRIFLTSKAVDEAAGNSERSREFRRQFEWYFSKYDETAAFDTYIFCLSEHDKNNTDGLLSMWRGYGGQGKGAALVFDTTQLTKAENSPLILAKVTYDSTENRLAALQALVEKWASILKTAAIPDDKFYLAIGAIFEQ